MKITIDIELIGEVAVVASELGSPPLDGLEPSPSSSPPLPSPPSSPPSSPPLPPRPPLCSTSTMDAGKNPSAEGNALASICLRSGPVDGACRFRSSSRAWCSEAWLDEVVSIDVLATRALRLKADKSALWSFIPKIRPGAYRPIR